MNKQTIKIAIALLENSRSDRYPNRRINHANRNFITATVIELLESIAVPNLKSDDPIITKNIDSFNPPEEP